MMAAGGVVLPTPTRQGRRRRGRRPRNGREGGGILDPISLSRCPCLNLNSIISPRTAGLFENLGTHGNDICESVLRELLLNPTGTGILRPPPCTSASSSSRLWGRINLPVSNAGGHFPSERERGEAPRGSVWDRLSPEKPIRRSVRDRIRWPVVPPEDLSRNGSNPKTLANLKPCQTAVNKDPLHSAGGQRNSLNAFLRPPPPDTSVSSSRRLQGRINMPVSNAGGHLPFEREMEERGRGGAPRGAVWDRLSSPQKPICRSLRDRIKRPVIPDDLNNDGSNGSRGPPIRRDLKNDRNEPAAFARPKTLANIKPGKTAVNKDTLHSVGGQRIASEGPQPLAVILKRKRDTPALQEKGEGSLGGSSGTSAALEKKRRGSLGGSSGTSAAPDKKRKGSLGGSSGTSSAADTSNAACSRPAKLIAHVHVHNDFECKSQEGTVTEAMEDQDMMTVIRGIRTISISAA